MTRPNCKCASISTGIGVLLLSPLFAILLVQPAVADSLPPPVWNASLGNPPTYYSTQGFFQGCGGECSTASSTSSVMAWGFGAGATSDATLQYEFSVSGPELPLYVPIIISGYASYGVYGSGGPGIASGGLAYGLFNDPASMSYLYSIYCTLGCSHAGAFSINTQARVNGVSEIILVAGGLSYVNGVNYTSSVDPTVMIDPSFPGADQYSITFSPGIGGPATPEPTSLVLLGTGLLLILGTRFAANGRNERNACHSIMRDKK